MIKLNALYCPSGHISEVRAKLWKNCSEGIKFISNAIKDLNQKNLQIRDSMPIKINV